MRWEEFDFEMDRLAKTYGENKYSKERREVFFETFGSLDVIDFSKAISQLIAMDEKPPLLVRISEILKDKLSLSNSEKIKQIIKAKGECVYCKNTGRLSVPFLYLGKIPQEMIYKCECPLNFQWPTHKQIPSNLLEKSKSIGAYSLLIKE